MVTIITWFLDFDCYGATVHAKTAKTPVLFSWEFSCNQLAHRETLHAIGYNQIPTK